MKTKLSGIIKWLVLAVFVVGAGCCYSCGLSGQPVGLSHGAEVVEKTVVETAAETAAESTGGVVAQTTPEESVEQPPICFVHVCGEVISPGVYELAEGQRVFEAVEQAGGFTEQAAESYLNLAEPVFDGMKIVVPDKSKVPEEQLSGSSPVSGPGTAGGAGIGGAGAGKAAGSTGAGTKAAAAKININTATKEELMTLRGIGEARAEDIIRYRQQRGGFGSIEDIMEVSGIKDAAFQKIKDDITV